MPFPVHKFFECDDPSCRLRFPASDGFPRWNCCPACRSSIHLVATAPLNNKQAERVGNDRLQHVSAMLDNLRSAWNVGSIFRTADGTGIQKVYLCGITPTPENSKVSKTALGAEANLPWEKHHNAVDLACRLKSGGHKLWALEDLPGARLLFDVNEEMLDPGIILVVGNEVSGIDPGLIELCDEVISIPMLGRKQSYNVAVAFAMAASFLLYRQIFSQESRSIFPNT